LTADRILRVTRNGDAACLGFRCPCLAAGSWWPAAQRARQAENQDRSRRIRSATRQLRQLRSWESSSSDTSAWPYSRQVSMCGLRHCGAMFTLPPTRVGLSRA